MSTGMIPDWARDESDSSKDSLQSLALSSDHDPPPEPTGRKKRKGKRKDNGKAGKGWFGANGGATGGYGSLKDYPVEVLRYKSRRGCCLSFFGVVHITTLLAALASAISQAVDILNAGSTEDTWWTEVQHTALRCYGVCFALGVVLGELSELDHCASCLASWREMPLMRLWPVRGLIYVFVGLYGIESSREHVGDGLVTDDVKTLRVVIGLSGTILMLSGVLYFLLGVSCCRRLKKNMVNELNEVRALLAEMDPAGLDEHDERAKIDV